MADTTKSTVQKDQKAKIEGMQDAAEQAEAGVRPANPTGAPPPPTSGKGEKRLFQVNASDKVWLTEAEATKRGFFWNPAFNQK